MAVEGLERFVSSFPGGCVQRIVWLLRLVAAVAAVEDSGLLLLRAAAAAAAIAAAAAAVAAESPFSIKTGFLCGHGWRVRGWAGG